MLHFVDRSGRRGLYGWILDNKLTRPSDRFFVANSHLTDQLESGLTRFFYIVLQAVHWLNKIPCEALSVISKPLRSRKSALRDLLDPTLMYSSALFSDDNKDLRGASLEKLDHICRKLHLMPTDHVLEIGTGWGVRSSRRKELWMSSDNDNDI